MKVDEKFLQNCYEKKIKIDNLKIEKQNIEYARDQVKYLEKGRNLDNYLQFNNRNIQVSFLVSEGNILNLLNESHKNLFVKFCDDKIELLEKEIESLLEV